VSLLVLREISQMKKGINLFIKFLRSWYLQNCVGVLYTPEREHFGIVPIEAMYNEAPVIACNSGGPKV
jgi:glycosyltransferase involved in cell wall biosynthesis